MSPAETAGLDSFGWRLCGAALFAIRRAQGAAQRMVMATKSAAKSKAKQAVPAKKAAPKPAAKPTGVKSAPVRPAPPKTAPIKSAKEEKTGPPAMPVSKSAASTPTGKGPVSNVEA